jgi:hypothetical protein
MRTVVLGAHLRRDDIEPHAEAIAVGGLWLSGVAIHDDQPLGDRALLVRVAGIRAKLLDAATFIAIRYGLTVRSGEEALERCASHLESWKTLLARHRDDVEILLKTKAADPKPRPVRGDFQSGGAYLKALHEVAKHVQPDPGLRAAIDELLLPLASQHRWMTRDEKSIELAMLVSRARVEEMREAGDRLRERAAGIPFLLSGPWPLEIFADADQQ